MDKRSLWQRKALKGSRLRLLIWGVLAAFFVVVPITHRRIGGLGSSLAHSPDVARGGGCRPDGPRRNPRHTHALPRWITW